VNVGRLTGAGVLVVLLVSDCGAATGEESEWGWVWGEAVELEGW
jgi:hypothetical protein